MSKFVLRWNQEVYFAHDNLEIYIYIQEEKSATEGVKIWVISHLIIFKSMELDFWKACLKNSKDFKVNMYFHNSKTERCYSKMSYGIS